MSLIQSPAPELLLPAKMMPVFMGSARYRGSYGGRGSAKSRSFGGMMLAEGTQGPGPLHCCRELQNSLRDSVHAELCALIDELKLGWFYETGREFIRSRHNFGNRGYTEFVYSGLRNSQGIKSKSRFRRAWVEEAEYVSEQSWKDLIPTIRMPNSEIWLTWNREIDGSATDRRFIKTPPTNARIAEMNWQDNPWFPDVLRQEMLDDYRRDPDMADHVWGGNYISRSDAQVLRDKWRVEAFDPKPGWDGPYDGADWGFSQDPTTRVRVWIDATVSGIRNLMIEREVVMIGCELLDLPELFDQFPDSRRTRIRADNARPETISHMRNAGFDIVAADKWPGSVQDGITHLRGNYDKIIIHPRCENAIIEARLYSHKVDRLTKDVLPDIISKHDHVWDAVRYALDPVIQRVRGWFD